MLCYAWDVLPIDADQIYRREEVDDIANLMGRILHHSLQLLIKRGFHREYVEESDELSSLRGRIDVSESIHTQSFIRKRMHCRYDELSIDVPLNRIIKTTLGILLRFPLLDATLKSELRRIAYSFHGVAEIQPSIRVFSTLRYQRNNHHYRMIMGICQLVFEGLLANEENAKTDDEKEVRMADFVRNRLMAKLYEKFVLNFYKKCLSTPNYKVHSPKIPWDIDRVDSVGLEFLPEMRTDIVLENSTTNRQLILDTKYYSETLTQRNFGTKKTLITTNLYQVYTYMGNSLYEGQVLGMLLYPTIDQELDLAYQMPDGRVLYVKTLNLAGEWAEVQRRLMGVVEVLA